MFINLGKSSLLSKLLDDGIINWIIKYCLWDLTTRTGIEAKNEN